jgi:catechol-2,3-dioxygenase
VNRPGAIDRVDERAEAVREPTPRPPRRLGHIVLTSTDVPASRAFYLDGLGFRLTEVVGNGAGVFARCSPDHHNLLIMAGKVPHLNHYAFEMDDVDAIGKAAQAVLDEAPDRHVVGLGRHAAGSNLFWYLLDPAGTMFEFFSDMDRIEDEARWVAALAREQAEPAGVKVWGPETPREFFTPVDLDMIAAGRAAEGL